MEWTEGSTFARVHLSLTTEQLFVCSPTSSHLQGSVLQSEAVKSTPFRVQPCPWYSPQSFHLPFLQAYTRNGSRYELIEIVTINCSGTSTKAHACTSCLNFLANVSCIIATWHCDCKQNFLNCLPFTYCSMSFFPRIDLDSRAKRKDGMCKFAATSCELWMLFYNCQHCVCRACFRTNFRGCSK
jgi:hypothetical protein